MKICFNKIDILSIPQDSKTKASKFNKKISVMTFLVQSISQYMYFIEFKLVYGLTVQQILL